MNGGVELSLTATYPRDTLWKVYRDGEHVYAVQASGPLSALVSVGRAMSATESCDGVWTVERAELAPDVFEQMKLVRRDIREAPKDYRYGGVRAALRWIFKGVAADADD